MRHLYLCALTTAMLFATACSKDGDSNPPAPQPEKTQVTFNYDQIGSFELSSMINGPGIYAKLSNGVSSQSFTYELVGSNGLKKATDTPVKGNGKLDGNGNATIELNGVFNYRDGEITLKVTFSGPDATVQAKTEKAEYKIRDYRDFINIAIIRNSDTSDHYVQVQDFAFPDTLFDQSPCVRNIKGSYDGQGHKITNLKMSAPQKVNESSYVGLFRYADSGSIIKNIRLELAPEGLIGADAAIGGIVGYASGANIIGCSVTGDILGNKDKSPYVGGICGYSNNSNMIGCSFRGHLRAGNVGGLIGGVTASSINMSYAYFSFDAYAAGGLVGLPAGGVGYITNSYAIVKEYNTDVSEFLAIGPLKRGDKIMTVTNCFALAGTPEEGVKMGTTISELGLQIGTVEVAEWPAGITAPADKRPFKLDTDLDHPLKLWWE